jgi:hypothetical protein
VLPAKGVAQYYIAFIVAVWIAALYAAPSGKVIKRRFRRQFR